MAAEATVLAGEFVLAATNTVTAASLRGLSNAVIATAGAWSIGSVVLGGFMQKALSSAVGNIVGSSIGFDLFGKISEDGIGQAGYDLYS